MDDFLKFMLDAIMDPNAETKDREAQKEKENLDLLKRAFMVAVSNQYFMKWVNRQVKNDTDKYDFLYLKSKYRYDEFLRGTTPGKYKKLRNVIATYEDIGTREWIGKFIELSGETDKLKQLKSPAQWIEYIMGADFMKEYEQRLTYAACYLEYIQGKSQDAITKMGITPFITSMLATESAKEEGIVVTTSKNKKGKALVKRLIHGAPLNPLVEMMGHVPYSMAKSTIPLFRVWKSDFETSPITGKQMNLIAGYAVDLAQNTYEDETDDTKPLTVKDKIHRSEMDAFYIGMVVAKLARLYSEAREIGIEYMDAADKYEEEVLQHRKDVLKMQDFEKLVNTKQEQLNLLQMEQDKLKKYCEEQQKENEFLQKLLKNIDKDIPSDIIEVAQEDDMDSFVQYPDGAILFGGHPNWQQKFADRHPSVKIMSGVDPKSPDNVVSASTPMVLLNSSYMSHSVFYKLRRMKQKWGFQFEYLK